MRTIELKILTFDELSKEAKEKALNDYSYDAPYYGSDEAIETLNKGAEYFGSKLADYDIDWCNSVQHRGVQFVGVVEQLTRKELRTLINKAGSYDKKTFKGHGACKLTGVCFDEDFLDGIRRGFFIDKITDINYLLRLGWNSLFKSCQEDYKYQLSEEGFKDHAEGNDFEFFEDGSRYKKPKK